MPAKSPDTTIDPKPKDRYSNFSITVPDFYNFGCDVVDANIDPVEVTKKS